MPKKLLFAVLFSLAFAAVPGGHAFAQAQPNAPKPTAPTTSPAAPTALAVPTGLAAPAASSGNIVDEIIARVDDSIITSADFEKAKQSEQNELEQQFPGNWQAKWDERQKDTMRGLIDRELLLEKGRELGVTGETETIKRLNQMRIQMGLKSMDDLEEEAKKQGVSYDELKEQIRTGAVAEQVIGQEVGSKVAASIKNEDVQEFYEKHQKDLEGPEEVGLSEIMISIAAPAANLDNKDNPTASTPPGDDPAKLAEAELKAKGLWEQLQKGAKFEDVAKKSSDGSTAAEGGTLGVFKRGELSKELEDKTFSLKAGEYTSVIRTKQGFIILKVNMHRAAGVPPVKDVENQIKEALYSQKLEPAARVYLTKLRDEAYIDIKPGYVDSGASPNAANKPVMIAANGPASSNSSGQPKKKKKKFLVF
ncbi:MAG TPA: peptidylprolyl isomerase [Terriglobales bacterium]